VSARKIGTEPGGSMITSSATRASPKICRLSPPARPHLKIVTTSRQLWSQARPEATIAR
jgi:hypothetical protein